MSVGEVRERCEWSGLKERVDNDSSNENVLFGHCPVFLEAIQNSSVTKYIAWNMCDLVLHGGISKSQQDGIEVAVGRLKNVCHNSKGFKVLLQPGGWPSDNNDHDWSEA